MKFILRLFIFALLFLVLGYGGLMVEGFSNAMHAHAAFTDPVAAKQASHKASEEFFFHYGPLFVTSVFLLSALIAFGIRRLTLVLAGCLSIGLYFWLSFGVVAYQTRHKPTEVPVASVTPTTPRPTRVGKRVTLLSPVPVKLAYGQATLPKGTVVTIVSESANSAEVKAPDGSTLTISLTQIQQ